MAQVLRPDATLTQTDFTGGFAEIDEASASDADFAYGADNTAAVLEVSLGNPSGTPGSGTCTVRYRVAKVDGGVVSGSGSSCTVTGALLEGGSVVATDSARDATGTWTTHSFTFPASSVTDWTNLRFQATTSSSGGSPANRRGGAVSWMELEVPDAAVTVTASPGAGVLVAAGLAATVAVTAHQLVTASLAALSLTSFAPTVTATAHRTVTPGTGVVAVAGLAPSLGAGGAVSVTPADGTLTLAGLAPSVTASAHVTCRPSPGVVTLTGTAPSLIRPVTVRPGVGVLTATGIRPVLPGQGNAQRHCMAGVRRRMGRR